jgi:hypothetical protein
VGTQPRSFIRHTYATRLSPESDIKMGSYEMSLSFLATWNTRHLDHCFYLTCTHTPFPLPATARSFTKPVYLHYRWSSLFGRLRSFFSTHSLMFILPHCGEVET